MDRHLVRVRVIYADTDALGIVYHTNYIRWFEMGRTELLREMGIVYAEMESPDFNLPLTKVYCHYLSPASFDQVVLVESAIDYVKRASIRFSYIIWNEGRTQRLVEGYTVHACTTKSGRIHRLPEAFLQKINGHSKH